MKISNRTIIIWMSMEVSGKIAAGSGKTYTFTLPMTVTGGLGLGTIVEGSESCALNCSYDSTSVYLRAGNKNDTHATTPTRVGIVFFGF